MTDSLPTPHSSAADLSDVVRPQDDFFRHVNGPWMARTRIPADKANYGSFDMLFDDAEESIRLILEELRSSPDGTEERKIGDLYDSFLDTTRVETLGVTPLRTILDRIATTTTMDDFLATVGELQREQIGGFYRLIIDSDPGNPDRYVAFFEQGGISLPDESYYREEKFAHIRDAYLAHLGRVFTMLGSGDAAAQAQRVFDLETTLARHHWNNVDSRDMEKTYNLVGWPDVVGEFSAVTATSPTGVNLERWREGLDVPTHAFNEVVVRQPSFTTGLCEVLAHGDLDAWRDWLTWHVLRVFSPYLSSDFVDANFDFFGHTLSGVEVLRERWKRAVGFVEGAMGEAVGKVYVARHFPPQVKERMDTLVVNLIEAYRQSITTLSWMTQATRKRALEKLAMFTPKIGYPDVWRDYTSLTVDPDDLIANVRAASAFEFTRNITKLGGPIDRGEWGMTPQTVNAYYNPGFNEIVFPAAVLQPPFFDAAQDDAGNYGAIGAIIGHEIGHGFDDQGSKFDGAGRLVDWWETADRSAFEERAKVLIEQFDALSPAEAPEHHVNGALTIGENIGDLGGLGIAWKAYQLHLNGAPAPMVDGLSGAERFFISWAKAWQNLMNPEVAIQLLAVDEHSPPEFRCNQIVRNLDAFYDTFSVQSSDAMWLEPSERVTIW